MNIFSFISIYYFYHAVISGNFTDSDFPCVGKNLNAKYSTLMNDVQNHSLEIIFPMFSKFSDLSSFPAIRVFISEISILKRADEKSQISFVGIIECDFRLLEYFQYTGGLSLCVKSIYSDMEPWCYPFDGLNYLSFIKLIVDDEILSVHMWLQLSSGKGGLSSHTYEESDKLTESTNGKIVGSDNYLVLDLRLPDGGFDIHKNVRREFRHDIYLNPSEKVIFYVNMTDDFSLQRTSTDFCRQNHLNTNQCGDFVQAVSKSIYRAYVSTDLITYSQNMPSPREPFVFIHIEKTAGTTMRE